MELFVVSFGRIGCGIVCSIICLFEDGARIIALLLSTVPSLALPLAKLFVVLLIKIFIFFFGGIVCGIFSTVVCSVVHVCYFIKSFLQSFIVSFSRIIAVSLVKNPK